MIEIKNLYKSFEDKEVLHDISAVFENGKTNLIIGQSGSGKTVLMKNLVGLLDPTKGQVLYDGRDFVAMGKREKVMLRREMGMIFQSAALFDSLSVLENVMFPLDMFSSMNLRERIHRAKECLDRVNLVDAHNKYPGEISGGMQKRVAIARAIALNPRYLFCDEPNSGLDPKTSLVIDDLLSSITKEYTTSGSPTSSSPATCSRKCAPWSTSSTTKPNHPPAFQRRISWNNQNLYHSPKNRIHTHSWR